VWLLWSHPMYHNTFGKAGFLFGGTGRLFKPVL
jgi:hypothetical protein